MKKMTEETVKAALAGESQATSRVRHVLKAVAAEGGFHVHR